MDTLYSSYTGSSAHLVGVEARPFEFEVRQKRAEMRVHSIGDIPDRESNKSNRPTGEVVYGATSTFGKMQLLSRTPLELEAEYTMEIFSNGKHAATLRSVLLTSVLREYNLADRYIYEVQFIAGTVDKPKGDQCGY
jgi:hypothetical protein